MTRGEWDGMSTDRNTSCLNERENGRPQRPVWGKQIMANLTSPECGDGSAQEMSLHRCLKNVALSSFAHRTLPSDHLEVS